MFVSLNVNNIIGCNWLDRNTREFVAVQRLTWEKENTYFIIFNNHQKAELDFFKANCGGFNILYEGKPAWNKIHYNEGNRNVLIVFEVQDRFFEPAPAE